MALETEIVRWKNLRQTLASEEEKQAFDEVMDMCRNNGMTSSKSFDPILFEPMVISILLGQQKRIRTLQRKIDALLLAMLPIEKTNQS
jgi:hypothetical protein